MRRYIFLFLLIVSMILFSACGSSDKGGKAKTESDANSSSEVTPFYTDEYGFKLIDLEIAAEIEQKNLDKNSAYSDTIKVKVFVRDNNIVYAGHLVVDIEDKEALKAELEKGTQRMSGYYNDFAKSLFDCGSQNSAVVIEYYTKDGEQVYSKDFKYTPPNW